MSEAPNEEELRTISFDYVKGNDFRVIHADGAFVAGKPDGLTISFYSERQPIPRRVVHKVTEKDEVGEEISERRVVRDAIIRDVDVTLTMNLEVAKSTHKTLGDIIAKVEETIAMHQRGK